MKNKNGFINFSIILFVIFVTVFINPCFSNANKANCEIDALKEQNKIFQEKFEQIKKKFAETQVWEKKNAMPVYAFWKNDFYLSTPDENFWMKIRGNLHFDSKIYSGNSNNPFEFDIRRARFDFQGMFYKYIYFRVQAELADDPYLRNAWADYKFSDCLHLRGGQMKPPFSTSWWTTDNNVNFVERGAGTPMYPYFDRGWWLWGDVLNKTLTWNVGAFTGAGLDKDTSKGDIDDHKDYVARLFYNPFKNQNDSFLKGLYLCIEGSTGRQSVPTKRFEKKGYGAAVRDTKFWTWETEKYGFGKIGSRDRWGAEFHYIGGPFSISSEYLVTEYNDIDVYDLTGIKVYSDDGRITSWSTWVSYYITGEHKRVSNFGWKTPKPAKNFNPVNFKGAGALEIIARYTSTKTSRSLFDPHEFNKLTYRILYGASRVDEYTIGFAWTWNPMIRWQFNYVHLDGHDLRTGSNDNMAKTNRVDNEDMVACRMIFKF